MQISCNSNKYDGTAQFMFFDLNLLNDLDRRTLFKVWQLTKKGKKVTVLCKALGISQQALSMLLAQETMPVQHHDALVAAGVPSKLLPKAEDKTLGRRPKPHPSLENRHG